MIHGSIHYLHGLGRVRRQRVHWTVLATYIVHQFLSFSRTMCGLHFAQCLHVAPQHQVHFEQFLLIKKHLWVVFCFVLCFVLECYTATPIFFLKKHVWIFFCCVLACRTHTSRCTLNKFFLCVWGFLVVFSSKFFIQAPRQGRVGWGGFFGTPIHNPRQSFGGGGGQALRSTWIR